MSTQKKIIKSTTPYFMSYLERRVLNSIIFFHSLFSGYKKKYLHDIVFNHFIFFTLNVNVDLFIWKLFFYYFSVKYMFSSSTTTVPYFDYRSNTINFEFICSMNACFRVIETSSFWISHSALLPIETFSKLKFDNI